MKGKVLLLFLPLFLLSCATKVTAPQVPSSASPSIEKVVTKEGWQKIWEDTLAQARKEGKVVVRSTMPPEVHQAILAAFKGKTGVSVEIEAGGRGGMLQQKVLAERKAGLYLVDLIIDSSTHIHTMKSAEAIEPFEKYLFLPEVIDPKLWYDSELPWFDKERTSVYLSIAPSRPLVVNTSLVNEGEFKTFRDLLNPKWKKKFVLFDPTFPGQGGQWFSVYARKELLGLDFMRALAKQEPILLRDARQQAEWVARGKAPVSLAVGWAIFEPMAKAGAPLTHVKTEEPDYLSAAVTFLVGVKDAPHPAAARLFLNWILSREGALVVQKSYERQSSREDTGNEGLERPGAAVRIKGEKYFNSAKEDHERERVAVYSPLAMETFSPLVR